MEVLMQVLFCNYFGQIFWGFVIIVIVRYIYQFYKIKKIIEIDSKYKKYNDQGQLIEDGHVRPIWDYSFFPSYSRLWHKKEWQLIVAVVFMAILLVLFLVTSKQEFLNLLGVNFGIIIGTLIKTEK
jgi:hypothetical protein